MGILGSDGPARPFTSAEKPLANPIPSQRKCQLWRRLRLQASAIAIVQQSMSRSFSPSMISTPYVSAKVNHFFDTTATV